MYGKVILYWGNACGSDIPVNKLGYGKIVGVPNKKNKIDYYSIKYDSMIEDESVSVYGTQIPGTQPTKKLLKEGSIRADDEGYRFELFLVGISFIVGSLLNASATTLFGPGIWQSLGRIYQ